MRDELSSTDVVVAFVSRMVQLRNEILAQVPGPPASLSELIRSVIAGRLHRRFQVKSGAHYAVHGVGVRMQSASGIAIDVDVDTRGHEIFDAWRVRSFAESASLGQYALGQLDLAMDALVELGTLATADHGFYRIAAPATDDTESGVG